MSKQRILIVEDEEFVQALLAAFLAKEGFVTALATTGKQMFAILDKDPVDLILLDLSLPDEDGLTLTRQVRARSSVPIIVLTARQGREARLAALEMGANDYLLKPTDPEELVLRVRNMLGRPGAAGEAAVKERGNQRVEFDGWTLDITGHSLTDGDGKGVTLTRAEFNLLAALARAPNRVLTRDFLLDAISRHDEAPTERVIDVLISRLRKKIERNPRQPQKIVTVLGCGYKFVRDGR